MIDGDHALLDGSRKIVPLRGGFRGARGVCIGDPHIGVNQFADTGITRRVKNIFCAEGGGEVQVNSTRLAEPATDGDKDGLNFQCTLQRNLNRRWALIHQEYSPPTW